MNGNISEIWRRFSNLLENYIIAVGQDERHSKVKAAILLNLNGEVA